MVLPEDDKSQVSIAPDSWWGWAAARPGLQGWAQHRPPAPRACPPLARYPRGSRRLRGSSRHIAQYACAAHTQCHAHAGGAMAASGGAAERVWGSVAWLPARTALTVAQPPASAACARSWRTKLHEAYVEAYLCHLSGASSGARAPFPGSEATSRANCLRGWTPAASPAAPAPLRCALCSLSRQHGPPQLRGRWTWQPGTARA
jgi:hypothetical protein